MDFTALQARTQALVTLGGWHGVSPAPDYADLVNQGLREFTSEAEDNPAGVDILLVIDTTGYSLFVGGDTRDWILLYDDAIADNTTPIYQTSTQVLRSQNRLWRSNSFSTPRQWYWNGPNEIGFYPGPSAGGSIVSFSGIRHRPALVSGADYPTNPSETHEAIALYAAWLHGKLYSRGEERQIAAGYKLEADEIVEKYKARFTEQEASLMVRRVSRTATEYLDLGQTSPAVYRW